MHLAALLALAVSFAAPLGDAPPAVAAAAKTIALDDLERHARALAGPELEGRDTPSPGLERAARYIAEQLELAQVPPLRAPSTGGRDDARASYFLPFTRRLPSPDAARCALTLEVDGEPARSFALDADFVPVAFAQGEAAGALVFIGFGINASREKFQDARGKDLEGAIAVLVEGEPSHPRLFDGPEISSEADLWEKLSDLRDAKVAGAIVVRRSPPAASKETVSEPPPLAMRSTWADWVGEPMPTTAAALPSRLPPTIEVSAACASALIGEDVEALARRIDASGKSSRLKPKGRRARFTGAAKEGDVSIDNVVAIVRGHDPALAAEHVVIGAHYDHVGVDSRTRIGCGADDNASGSASLLELAQAFAAAPPRRSIVLVWFAGEEDGLLGSRAFCRAPPVPRESIVAMLNLDMIGRGEKREVAVIGLRQNPELEPVLERARKLVRTGIDEIVVRRGEELFQRSDHYSFHEIGVPALFFFEGLPIEKNRDYHTWRDTLEHLDYEKIANTTRLVLNTAWILAEQDRRPPKPR